MESKAGFIFRGSLGPLPIIMGEESAPLNLEVLSRKSTNVP